MKATDTQAGGNHYKDMAIQPIEYMRANMTPEQFDGFCRGNILKYVSRAGAKKSTTLKNDLHKARHYIDLWLMALSYRGAPAPAADDPTDPVSVLSEAGSAAE